MNITRLTTGSELAALAADWNDLAGGVPLVGYDWLATWWKHYGPTEGGAEQELFVLEVREGAELAAIVPWYSQQAGLKGRTLRFLGSGEVCSDYLSFPCRAERESEVCDAVAEWLLEHTEAWDQLQLEGIDAEDRLVPPLMQRLAAEGCGLWQRPGLNTWRIPLPSSFDEYLAELSKNHRKFVRRVLKAAFAEGRSAFHTAANNDAEFEQGWEILVDLHQRRRNSLGEPGCFSSPRYAAFHREAARRLLHAGQLRLHWLVTDGQPIAAEYHLGGGGIVYAYQGGLDPDRLELEPGRVSLATAIERAIASGATAFDLMRGDETYKPHFRAVARSTVQYTVVPSSASDHFRLGMLKAGDSMKNWLKACVGKG